MDIVWIGGLAVLWIVVAELVVGLNRLDRQARPSGGPPPSPQRSPMLPRSVGLFAFRSLERGGRHHRRIGTLGAGVVQRRRWHDVARGVARLRIDQGLRDALRRRRRLSHRRGFLGGRLLGRHDRGRRSGRRDGLDGLRLRRSRTRGRVGRLFRSRSGGRRLLRLWQVRNGLGLPRRGRPHPARQRLRRRRAGAGHHPRHRRGARRHGRGVQPPGRLPVPGPAAGLSLTRHGTGYGSAPHPQSPCRSGSRSSAPTSNSRIRGRFAANAASTSSCVTPSPASTPASRSVTSASVV